MSCIRTSALFPRRAGYLHMTNMCRIYQLWECGIVNVEFLLLLVEAVIPYPSDSHGILRCWMFIKAQFSKHRVSVCMFISIM